LLDISTDNSDRPYFAQDMKGINLAANQDLPEWKKASFGGNKASFGKRSTLSILEQRQGLPIYKLREELIKVCARFIIIIIHNNTKFIFIFIYSKYFIYLYIQNTSTFLIGENRSTESP